MSVKLTHCELFEKTPMICFGLLYVIMYVIDGYVGPTSYVMDAFVVCSVLGFCIGLVCQIGP